MRIASQGQSIETNSASDNSKTSNVKENVTPPISRSTDSPQNGERVVTVGEEQEISREKLQQAVDAVNEFLKINHSSSKFIYHEGLERYYVAVVNEDTEEVVKEIPPKRLLDAFYEMQKLVGMIVDKKI